MRRTTVLRLATAAVLTGAGLAGTAATATAARAAAASYPATVRGQIVFDAELNHQSGNAIFSISPDGSHLRQLTATGAFSDGPDVSADGSRIAYYVGPDSGTAELWTMNADGTDQQQLTHDATRDWYPSWSPDGSTIAFRSDQSGDPEIWTIDVATKVETRLTYAPGIDSAPEFSPDGTKILFHTQRNDSSGQTQEVWVMDADGSDQHVVVTANGKRQRFPNWSPDGSRIVFERDASDYSSSEIWTANADGTHARVVPASQGYDAEAPDFSSDGRLVSWSDLGGLYTSPPGGTTAKSVVSDPDLYVLSTDWGPTTPTPGTSRTTLALTPQSPVYGQGITATAHVRTAGTATTTPTGSVAFTVDGASVGSAPLSAGVARIALPANLENGSHHVTATYGGDGDHAFSVAQGDVTVALASTTTTLSVADGATVAYGSPVYAVVRPQAPSRAAVPDGSQVHEVVDGQDVATASTTHGRATLPPLSPGTYSLQAVFAPTGSLAGSQSATVSITVTRAPTSLRITSSANPSTAGRTVRFVGRFTPTLDGFVDVTVDGVDLGDYGVTAGVVRFAQSFTDPGTHAIDLAFAGDDDHLPTSAHLDQQVD